MKELSILARNVNPSTTLAIDAMAKQMRADGLDVIGFGAGEPDFETPVNIQDVGVEAIRKGKTKYTPAAGIVELRKAAANRLKLDCGLDYDWSQIVVASGAKHNVYVALAALLDPGDEVIVPAPYWVSYCEMISMLGGKPVPVLAEEAQGFKITPAQLEAAVTAKTKAVMLNNPSNPTGMFYTRPELEALAEVCVRLSLIHIYVYLDAVSAAGQRPGVVGLRHRLCEPVTPETGKVFWRSPSEDEYRAFNTGTPELDALSGAGDCEGTDAAAAQKPCRLYQTVTVCLAFENRHQLTTGRQYGPQLRGVLPERSCVNLYPGSGLVVRRAGTYALPENQDQGRGCSRTCADSEVVTQAVFHHQLPQTQRPRRATDQHDYPGMQRVNQHGKVRTPARSLSLIHI